MKSGTNMPPLASYERASADDVLPALELAPTSLPAAEVEVAPGPVWKGDREARLRAMVDEHIEFVARVLRNAGTPQAEIDDQVQRTFIVAARRLDDVRLGAEKSFLFRIALNLAAHMRRTLARRREVPGEQAPERVEALATPEHLTDRKRMRELLDRVLDQMEGSLRDVFVLHEFEELNMSEIAGVLGIPRGTVASRLRRARAEFRERVGALDDLMASRRGR